MCEFVKSFITWKFLFLNPCWYHYNWKWTILIRLHFNAFDTKYCIWRGYNSYFLNLFVIKHKLYLQMMFPTTASSKTLSYMCNQWLLFIQDMNTVYCKHIFSIFFFIRMITKICTLQTSLLKKKTIIHCIRIYIKTVRFIFSGKKIFPNYMHEHEN